ncbi:TPA: ankyrin repeat domain-containing protein [Vibrio alginolyticus]
MKKQLAIAVLFVTVLTVSYRAMSNDTIHLAAYHGNEVKVIELLKRNPDPDARDSYGGTALHSAIWQDNVKIVQLLIAAGFDVNAVGPRNGYTPLHDAVWANNLPALKLLVANGGDLTIKGHDGSTPLSKAKTENKQKIITYLESL